MKIINLIENTEGGSGCASAHGLAFYIVTKHHRILLDLGPSKETLTNAEKLGIDLSKVELVILSHGHYDHGGGLPAFAELNPTAAVYMQRTAVGTFYADDGPETEPRYIGLERAASGLPQIIFVDGDFRIDDELYLLTVEQRKHPLPSMNGRLKEKQGDSFIPDGFGHEQSLVITESGKTVLMSGCAHNGILNILEEFRRKLGRDPDAVISGFHLMKKAAYTDDEIEEIVETAKALKTYDTQFYTCHCTGVPAFRVMQSVMGDRLDYVHSGDSVPLRFRTGQTPENGKTMGRV
ncbi:MAG: MBL fold metallo-hydrolase [Oscillospiraceae bacterium]|nr:MBL fold metallo-hydrolase [Oscillospiraceae bacterium]